MGDNNSDIKEIKELQGIALFVLVFLSLLIIACGILLIWMKEFSVSLMLGSVIAGILGCSSSALLSALDRKAKGWELENGDKHPLKKTLPGKENNQDNQKDGDNRDMFSKRMSTFFLFRPFLGIVAALLIYFGFGEFEGNDFSHIGNEAQIILLSLLAGLFAKSLLDKMKSVFDNVLGKK